MKTKSVRQRKVSADQYTDPDLKPTTLDPEVPRYSSDYFGPPPDAGFSYGHYDCPSCGEESYLVKGEEMHCPNCGAMYSEMPTEVSPEEMDRINTAAYSSTCGSCDSEIYTTDADYNGNNFCPQCGENMKGASAMAEDDIKKNDDEDENMGDEYQEEYLEDPDEMDEPISESAVGMTLFGADTENPHWNMVINGNPVAKICLQDQRDPEKHRPSFIDASYGGNTALAISKVGLKRVLSSLRAHVYAFKVFNTSLSKKIRKDIQTEERTAFKKARATLNSDLRTCINITLAGMNKNFFPELDNNLKDSLFTGMQSIGINSPQVLIEAAFKESADKFFDVVLNKAEALLQEEPVVLEALAKAIANVNTVMTEEKASASLTENDSEDLASRLAHSSYPLSFGGSGELAEELDPKEKLKQELGLGRKTW